MVKRNGTDRYGKQRFLCLVCGKTFYWGNKANKSFRERSWFVEWIKEGYSIRQLCQQSRHGRKKLKAIIRYWLDYKQPAVSSFTKAQHILCDGTFIEGRRHSVFAVMDGKRHELIAGDYDVKEKAKELMVYFNNLKQLGLSPKTATIDGNMAIIEALVAVWPAIIIQRCLVHIQRQGLMWCRSKPKRIDGKHLRKLFLAVTEIKTYAEAEQFLLNFRAWEQKYGRKLMAAKASGWVVSDLVRARSMLLNALPDMFHFLNNPNIPSTTNGLESYFSRLKDRYQNHRGLSKNRRTRYFQWYINLVKR